MLDQLFIKFSLNSYPIRFAAQPLLVSEISF